MKIINSLMYKTFIIWKLEDGYQVEGTDGSLVKSIKRAKEIINSMI